MRKNCQAYMSKVTLWNFQFKLRDLGVLMTFVGEDIFIVCRINFSDTWY